jgi:AcrR family transcriptional regulator
MWSGPEDGEGTPPGAAPDARRDRLVAAMAELVAQHGYDAVTINELARRARISTKTFYGLFPSKADCFFAMYDEVTERVVASLVRAWERGSDQRGRFERAVGAFLSFCAAEPAIARACLVEAPAVEPGGAARRSQTVQRVARLATHALPAAYGRVTQHRSGLPPVAALAAIGGIVAVVETRLRAADVEGLAALGPELTAAVFLVAQDL